MCETKTLDYYNKNASSFAEATVDVDFYDTQKHFQKLLPEQGYILDFGCGSGRDIKYFLSQHFQVDAIDGSEELCRIASDYTGIKVKKMLFKELEEIEDATAYSLNDEIQRKEILEILEKFLDSLKKGDRDIFIRRYWYMDSISEISARHGISESRIKSSLYRSRKKLWERVKHLYGKRI